MYEWLYLKLAKFTQGKKNKLITDITLIVSSGYLIFKKVFGISISKWLGETFLNENGVTIYLIAVSLLLGYALIIKILSLIFEQCPIVSHSDIEPEEISHCLLAINQEIERHLQRITVEGPHDIRDINNNHGFHVNIRLVIDALAEHLRGCITDVNVKRKDLFISLYTLFEDNDEKILKYELHFDHKRDVIGSKEIYLDREEFKDYECVKCIASSDMTRYVFNRNDYKKGSSKRHKTFQQYMGCKLHGNNRVFGFLNIEFHNHHIFRSEEDMQDFMESNIFPFKLLLEYQYLKRELFSILKEYNN